MQGVGSLAAAIVGYVCIFTATDSTLPVTFWSIKIVGNESLLDK